MVGYLKRGEAYRRRGELEAALKDLRRAADIDPGAPRALELLGDVNYSLLRYGRAADSYGAYIRLDDRSPRVLYKLAPRAVSRGAAMVGNPRAAAGHRHRRSLRGGPIPARPLSP